MMGPTRCVAAIALLGLLVPGPVAADEVAPHRDDCGTNALYFLLQLSDRPASLSDIERSLPARRAGGHSMADLRDAARSLGLPLKGLRIGPGDVPLDRPAIAFLSRPDEGHFVTLRPVGTLGTMVQILDPPHPPAVVDYEALMRNSLWTGRVLTPRTTAELAWSRGWPLVGAAVVLGVLLLRRRPIRRRVTGALR